MLASVSGGYPQLRVGEGRRGDHHGLKNETFQGLLQRTEALFYAELVGGTI